MAETRQRTGTEQRGTQTDIHKVMGNRWKQSGRGRQSDQQETQEEGASYLKREENEISK